MSYGLVYFYFLKMIPWEFKSCFKSSSYRFLNSAEYLKNDTLKPVLILKIFVTLFHAMCLGGGE